MSSEEPPRLRLPDLPNLPLEASLIIHLFGLNNLLERAGNRILSQLDLTLPQWMVLRCLQEAGEAGRPLSELSHNLLLSKAPVSGIIDRLGERGLVLRVRDTNDRRVVYARLTDRGRALADSGRAALNEWKDRVWQGFEDAEKQRLESQFRRLLDNCMRILDDPSGE